MDTTTTTVLVGIGTTITAFFFGKSGVLQKILDFILGQKKERTIRTEEEIMRKDKEIQELTNVVEELKETVFTLEKDLVQTNTYVRTLLAYLETLMPEGANPFIKEMAKEIRNKKNV